MRESAWVSDLHRVREGQQDRSRKTQAALLDAAEKLFAAHGVGGATITDISTAAGCSNGAFYHHYRDKQAIQFALFDRYEAELEETTRLGLDPNRWVGATIGDILYGYVELSLHNDRQLPERMRAGVAVARAEPQIQQRLVEHRERRTAGLRQLLLSRRNEIGHDHPVLAISFVLDQLSSMMRVRMFERREPAGFGCESDDDFAREALRSVCSYLQIENPYKA